MKISWRNKAHKGGAAFIPAISPGYNDRGVRYESGHPALSRQLYKGTEEGALFKESLKKALELIDKSTNNLLMVNSFNEWHEDSQIGPLWPHLVSLSSRQQLGLST